MLWMYIAMLETAEQKEKITYIYENYADLMYCEALKVVGEHYLAEDVVHETFLHLIRILDDVEVADTKKLKRFLTIITHSKGVDIVRKLNRMKPARDEELLNWSTPTRQEPEEVVLHAIEFEALVSFVSRMDDKYKAPLNLRRMGYSIQEIARIHIIFNYCFRCSDITAAVKYHIFACIRVICPVFFGFPRIGITFMYQIDSYNALFFYDIVPVKSCLLSFKNPIGMSSVKFSQIVFIAFRKSLRRQIFFKISVIYIVLFFIYSNEFGHNVSCLSPY